MSYESVKNFPQHIPKNSHSQSISTSIKMKENDYVWEEIWRKDPYSSSKERESRAKIRLRQFRAFIPKDKNLGRVIEFGCGDGSFAKELLSDDTIHIEKYHGFDKSSTAISRAIENLKLDSRAEFKCTDIHDIDAEKFEADTIISFGLLEHIRDINGALAIFSRICSPDGLFITTMSNTLSAMYIDRRIKERLGSWRYGYQKNYHPGEWRNLLQGHFNPRELKIFHGDWDNKAVAIIDRFGSIFNKKVGRYIISSASPK